jgi:hypothetical protein
MMPDMTADLSANPQNMVPFLLKFANHSSVLKIDDKLLLSPYNAQSQNVSWWTTQLATLAQSGAPSLFVPLFQGFKNYISKYANISYGASDWGSRNAAAGLSSANDAPYAHKYVPIWMAPIAMQGIIII